MGDQDLGEFYQLSKLDQRQPCRIAPIRDQLAPVERKLLDRAFDDSMVQVRGIINWLGKRGIETSVSAVTTHRNKKCRCFR